MSNIILNDIVVPSIPSLSLEAKQYFSKDVNKITINFNKNDMIVLCLSAFIHDFVHDFNLVSSMSARIIKGNTDLFDSLNMKISNQAIEKFLYDNADKEDKPKKKALVCTKCKGSSFLEQDDLRKHFKTNWHNFNAKLSAQSKESLTAEEYDEYIMMHPESLK